MKKIKKEVWIHIILISLILFVICLTAIKIIRWSTSSSEIDFSEIDMNEFMSESEDFYATKDISNIENYEDDGILTVVMLGDDSLQEYADGSGVPEQVRSLLEKEQPVEIYNCNFHGATMTSKNEGFDGTYGEDAFSFYYTSMCILNDTYLILDKGLETTQHKDAFYEKHIDTLKSIDFSKVDVIVLSYGAEDYLLSRYVVPANDTTEQIYTADSTIYTDALIQGVTWIQMAYPQIQFVVMSPTFCYYVETNGELSDCDIRHNDVNGVMSDYMVCGKVAAVQINTTYLDNYWGIPIHSENAKEYLTESTTYPNADGRALIAKKLAHVLQTKIYYKAQ